MLGDMADEDDARKETAAGPLTDSLQAPGKDWLYVPRTWYEADPEAIQARSNFVLLCQRGSAEQVTEILEAIWAMLDRAALWVSSIHTDLASTSTGFVDRSRAVLLPTIPRQIRALAHLGRASLDHLPAGMAAARSAFESGLRAAWIDASQDPQERVVRILSLHNHEARWKNAVAADFGLDEEAAERWRQAANVQAALVAQAQDRIGREEPLPRVPSVKSQLHQLDLDRLYSGYRLASEYVHGGLTSALEVEAIRTENSPFGIYWPNDWFLAVSMCAWACSFVAHHASEGFDPGPLRGIMLAAELLLLSPGPGWRRGSPGPSTERSLKAEVTGLATACALRLS
jgi:hypothetical protein